MIQTFLFYVYTSGSGGPSSGYLSLYLEIVPPVGTARSYFSFSTGKIHIQFGDIIVGGPADPKDLTIHLINYPDFIGFKGRMAVAELHQSQQAFYHRPLKLGLRLLNAVAPTINIPALPSAFHKVNIIRTCKKTNVIHLGDSRRKELDRSGCNVCIVILSGTEAPLHRSVSYKSESSIGGRGIKRQKMYTHD
jgi:hypothetical protein